VLELKEIIRSTTSGCLKSQKIKLK